MRLRKASVSALEVISPRAIRRPASAMPSVVRSVMWRPLFVGAEDERRFGGPSEAAWNALHQLEQADIALVEMLDVLGRERDPGERGARPEFLKCWRLRRRHTTLP